MEEETQEIQVMKDYLVYLENQALLVKLDLQDSMETQVLRFESSRFYILP